MEYIINAKPTNYNGRIYRSRLEAKWAAFFDHFNWHYEYEPFEINGWSPDFLLHLPEGCWTDIDNVLVEVKPEALKTKELHEKIFNAVRGLPYIILVLNENAIEYDEMGGTNFCGKMPLQKTNYSLPYKENKLLEFSVTNIFYHVGGNYSIMQIDNNEGNDGHWNMVSDEDIKKVWDEVSNKVRFYKNG